LRGSMKRITNAHVVTEDETIPNGCVDVEEDIIVAVSPEPMQGNSDDIDLEGAWLVPGFLDVHVHLEAPSSLSDLRQYVQDLSRDLLSIGTTGILWTLGNMPFEKMIETAAGLREVLENPPVPCVVLGIHFEGPYISPNSLGAFDPSCIGPPEQYPLERLLEAAGASLKYLSLSPDVPGALDVIRECVRRGVRVGLGHSLALPEILEQAVEAGATSIIHTFNNTPCYPMKEPGVRGITLDEFGMSCDRLMSEVICDGIHVDPLLVRALARAKGCDRVMIVTDSIGGGRLLPEGRRLTVGQDHSIVRGGVGRNQRGQMAGSALTMERAFRNFVNFTGSSMPDAVRVTSLNAARFLGLDHERGRISPGSRADFAVLDEKLTPCMNRLAAWDR